MVFDLTTLSTSSYPLKTQQIRHKSQYSTFGCAYFLKIILVKTYKFMLTKCHRPSWSENFVLIFLRFIIMTDIANRVKKIVAEHLGVEESKVTDTASFIGIQ